jgi:hypothetical protein
MANPGLSVQGTNARLKVNGSVIVNSYAEGKDQYGHDVNSPYMNTEAAIETQHVPSIVAELVSVCGGVDNPNATISYSGNGPPLDAGTLTVAPDPLRQLPIPVPGSNGVSVTMYGNDTTGDKIVDPGNGNVSVGNGKTLTFLPGLYHDISITGSANVTFRPGIYIFSPSNANEGLRINGSPTITGYGVMFYFTGSDYLTATDGKVDYYDRMDGPLDYTAAGGFKMPASTVGEDTKKVKFATLDYNAGGSIQLTGITDPANAFHNVLFYYRRRNTASAQIQGNAGSNVLLGGTIYASGNNWGLANRVYLVE